MSVGEMIAALAKYAGDFDGDELLMVKTVDSIEVGESTIKVYFTDYNTSNVEIDAMGNFIRYLQ